MSWKKIASKKDDGTFAIYGMKNYLSQCASIYPYTNSECINYIVETFLECIDSVDFHTWLKNGNGDGRPIIITQEMLQKDFKDLLMVSEDLDIIRDLFMYLYDVEMWIDRDVNCLYTTMFHIPYTNRKKLNFIDIVAEFERLNIYNEQGIINWKDIDNFVECVTIYGYDIEKDYEYRTDNLDETISNIIERMQQVFLL